MAEVILKNIKKVYPHQDGKKKKKKGAEERKSNLTVTDEGVLAVHDFNLSIKDKEFIVLVGPSGCGKSTTLRMVAGLEEISGGELYIDGTLVNDVAPKDRNIAMVFQSYALYPQMNIYDNIAFSLQVRKVPKKEIDKRVHHVAELLGLENLLKQRPKNLSGGQRQRVAIGNAIIREPKVLLMDEPLSNLDAKLRTQMRVELAGIHKALGNTIIYVTHDQTEAMTLGDRIVVMNQGAVQQADTPQNLYAYPVNRFVAGFIGSPSMNFIKGLAMEKMGIPTFCTEQDGDIPIPDFLWKILKRQGYIGRNIELGIRPEHFLEKPAGADTRGEWKMEVTVTARELLGAEVILHFNHNGQDCCAKVSGDSLIDKGDSVTLWIDMAYISAFDMETQENITLKRGAFS